MPQKRRPFNLVQGHFQEPTKRFSLIENIKQLHNENPNDKISRSSERSFLNRTIKKLESGQGHCDEVRRIKKIRTVSDKLFELV